jgi:DNA polymerase-3 subunit delta
LIDLAGRSPPILEREVEKLENYCLGQKTVALADVEAVCGDALGAETDELVDAVLGGGLAEVDRYFLHLTRSGIDAGRILSALHGQLLRLIDLRQSIERGTKPEQVVKAARPPIFFKRQSAILGYLRIWPVDGLLAGSSSVYAAIIQTRLNPELAEAHANRALLALSRNARALKTRMT